MVTLVCTFKMHITLITNEVIGDEGSNHWFADFRQDRYIGCPFYFSDCNFFFEWLQEKEGMADLGGHHYLYNRCCMPNYYGHDSD